MYLEIFLADFAVFRGISRKYLNFAGPRPREISEALYHLKINKLFIFSILVILWPITWPYAAITFFFIAFSNYNVLFFHCRMFSFVWSQLKLKKLFFSGFTQTWKVPEFLTKSSKSPWISSRVYPWKSSRFEKENFRNIRISYLTVAGIPNV